ncbi:MAG: efflux transporter periplasmic adaptor subunit, partial [Acidobacteriota bacterium]
ARRAIELGTAIDDRRVVRSGLDPGDRVVTDGLQMLQPGVPILPQDGPPAAMPAGGPPPTDDAAPAGAAAT